jgi:hypothetical protein
MYSLYPDFKVGVYRARAARLGVLPSKITFIFLKRFELNERCAGTDLGANVQSRVTHWCSFAKLKIQSSNRIPSQVELLNFCRDTARFYVPTASTSRRIFHFRKAGGQTPSESSEILTQ